MSAETTIQTDVGPGDQTDLYYITICNLPFGTSWQQLKDWTRSACDVDHVEVFPTSTSGWVRVKGKANFEKAWARLNGGVFNGRSIIASDKNRTQSIKIKELIDSSSEASYSQTPRYQPPTPTQYGSPTSPVVSPQYSTTSRTQYYTGSYPQVSGIGYSTPRTAGSSYNGQPSFPMATGISTYAATDKREYHSEMNPSAAPYSPQHGYGGSQYVLPYRSHSTAYSTSPTELAQPTDYVAEYPTEYSSEYLPTELRQVYVKNFPQQAGIADVVAWIQRKSGQCGSQIINIEVPQNNNSKYLRGHALVTYDSAFAATTAMDLLNKSRFQNQKVTARPALEGASSNEPPTHIPTGPRALEKSHRSKHKSSKGSSGDSSSRPHKSSSSDKKHSSSDKKSSSSSRKGQSSSDKKKVDRKTSSSDRKSSKEVVEPVIVDGTAGKNDK